MHSEYDAAARNWWRIHSAHLCAQNSTNEDLLKHKNQFGLIDISKVYCADKTFWASLEEIRGADRSVAISEVDYWKYVYPDIALINGVAATVYWRGCRPARRSAACLRP